VVPVTRTWSALGPVPGNFSTPGNWNPAGAPGAADTLVFNGGARAINDIGGLTVTGLSIDDPNQIVELDAGLNVTGNVTLNNGKLTGAFSLTMTAAGIVNITGGTLDTFFWIGGVGVQPKTTIDGGTGNSQFTITSNGRFDNYGSVSLEGSGSIINNGDIVNDRLAVFDIQSDVDIDYTGPGPGTIDNQGGGRFAKQGGTASRIQGDNPFMNEGDLTLWSGTLTLQQGMEQTTGQSSTNLVGGNLASSGPDLVFASGSLTGNGAITGNVVAGDGGFQTAYVQPGILGAPGTISITGNYTQASNGNLTIAINQFGQFSLLSVSGTATLGGVAQINKSASYTPPYGQTIGFLQYGALGLNGGVPSDFVNVFISNNEWTNGGNNLRFVPHENATEYDLFADYNG
jgi:hypothetical protein